MPSSQARSTKGSGWAACGTAAAGCAGPTAPPTRGSGVRTSQMVSARSGTATAACMLECGRPAWPTASVSSDMRAKASPMQASSGRICRKGLGWRPLESVLGTKATSTRARSTASASTLGPMALSTAAAGGATTWRGRARTPVRMADDLPDSGGLRNCMEQVNAHGRTAVSSRASIGRTKRMASASLRGRTAVSIRASGAAACSTARVGSAWRNRRRRRHPTMPGPPRSAGAAAAAAAAAARQRWPGRAGGGPTGSVLCDRPRRRNSRARARTCTRTRTRTRSRRAERSRAV
mmetsp:Transcript_176629/g.566361  ORF Transcript_176629/g.566361 Transcript_176629/m.566361 type:complete len:292 (-) Transcript_176629:29-904(-)